MRSWLWRWRAVGLKYEVAHLRRHRHKESVNVLVRVSDGCVNVITCRGTTIRTTVVLRIRRSGVAGSRVALSCCTFIATDGVGAASSLFVVELTCEVGRTPTIHHGAHRRPSELVDGVARDPCHFNVVRAIIFMFIIIIMWGVGLSTVWLSLNSPCRTPDPRPPAILV